jgi:hypothetical protein
MGRNITKELALKIRDKLGAQAFQKPRKQAAHDHYGVYHEGRLVGMIGIRRGSSKDAGHDHIPRDLNVNPNLAKQIGVCTKDRGDYIQRLRELGLLPEAE